MTKTRMKTLTIAAILSLVSLAAPKLWSQGGGFPNPVPVSATNLQAFPIYTLNVAPVSGATLTVNGQPGQANLCYWAVANFQVGAVVSPLGCVPNAPNTLSSQNNITINLFNFPTGTTGVDILQNHDGTKQPHGTGNFAVATGVTSGTISQTSNTLSSYAVPDFNPLAYAMTLTAEAVGTNSVHMLLRQGWPWPGTIICDLSTGCGGGGGGSVYVNSTSVTSPNFNNSTPAPSANSLNLQWQFSGSNVSAQIVGDGNSAHYLSGLGTWTTPTSAFQLLTTTGSGAATLSAGVLNIPIPPFQFLTTTGSGAATLSGGVLNIPVGGSGGLSGLTNGQVVIASGPTTAGSSLALVGGGTNPVACDFSSIASGQMIAFNGSGVCVNVTPGVQVDTSNTATIPASDNVSFLAPTTLTTLSGANTLSAGFTFSGCNLNASNLPLTYTPASGLIYPGGTSTATIAPNQCWFAWTNGTSTYMPVLLTSASIQPDNDSTSIALGPSAAAAQSSTGRGTVAIGASALQSLTTSAGNTAVGYQAAYNATGTGNTALGYNAFVYGSTGGDNTAVGYEALLGISSAQTTGNNNTAVGEGALQSVQGAGANNTAIGYSAGRGSAALTTGTNDTFLGYEADPSAATDINEIVISGNAVTGLGSNSVNIANVFSVTGTNAASTSETTVAGDLTVSRHLNQHASGNFGGSCAMSSATTCTVTLSASYTTPVCVATEQTTGTVIAAACSVSSTTATVTAASSNSATWGVMVFGNPN